MAAISGAAGLKSALAAIERGATVALANKECLVCAGALFMRCAASAGATVLPVDSEHNAVFQALGAGRREDVKRVILTASGGPFRTWTLEQIKAATPEQALRHPNWVMGPKITIDSATMMNKGLELIEAHHLFALKPDEIDAMRAWGEGWIMLPVWLNNSIEHVHDAQFSVDHGLAVAAQRIPPGPAWQDPAVVFSPSVLELMDKITFDTHPDFVNAINIHPASRPSRIEIDARGTTFVAERQFPKGSPSPDPSSFMTTDELVEKFQVNAAMDLPRSQADEAVAAILDLEKADDVSQIVRLLGTADRG